MAVPRWLSCVVFVVACSHTDRPADAQSLVDVARLARASRVELGPPTKVYTHEDLPDTGRITEPTPAWVFRYHIAISFMRLEKNFLLLKHSSILIANDKTISSDLYSLRKY